MFNEPMPIWHRLIFLLHDGIDGIGTEGWGIVTKPSVSDKKCAQQL